MADGSVRGHFVWHELMTTDTKSAAGFFTKIIGWKTKSWDQDPSYTMFVTDPGRPMAGLMPLPDGGQGMGGRPVWVSYIGTPNVDETARQAEKLGGKILKQPADIPTIGRFAVIADPQGGVFNAFTPLQGNQPEHIENALGDFSWHELPTTDWRAALTFYKTLFGWEETSAMDMGPEMGTYQMFGIGGRPLGGIFNKPKEMPGPPAWLPYIHVSDAKKVAAEVKKQGGQVINGPMEVPGGDWIAAGLDKQGAMFAVHSLKPVAAKKPGTAKGTKKKSKAPKRKSRKSSKSSKSKSTKKKPKTAKTRVKRSARRPARKAKRAVSRRRR